jgi:hypothetical protein
MEVPIAIRRRRVKKNSLTSMLVLSMILGCSSEPGGSTGGNGGAGGSPGGTGGLGATGTGGSTGTGGGSGGSTGGGTGGNVVGTGGSPSDASAADLGGGQGGSGGGGPSAGPFTCSLVLGMFTTSQWFNGTNPGGASKTFLQQDGIDPKKWEGKMAKYSYSELWADPASDRWKIATANPCAMNAMNPDRVVFVEHSQTVITEPTMQATLQKIVANIQMKFPGVKEIDLLSMGRTPGNVMCPNNNDKWTVVPPYVDAAIQAVADASNGLVKVGPKYEVPDCKTSYIFANDTDYTTSAANALAVQLGMYYAAHP